MAWARRATNISTTLVGNDGRDPAAYEIARRTRRADSVCPRRIRVGAFEMRPETRTLYVRSSNGPSPVYKVDLPTCKNGRAMEAWRIFAAPGGGRSSPRP